MNSEPKPGPARLKTNSPPAPASPRLLPPLSDEEWRRLLARAEVAARFHINKYFWRGSTDGILPDGFDPSSIAAEALAQLIGSTVLPQLHWSVYLAPPLSGPQARPALLLHLEGHLNRLVLRQVDRLRHRKENLILCNADDLVPLVADDGGSVPFIDSIVDSSAIPADLQAIAREDNSRDRILKSRFESFLGPERRLKRALNHLTAGCLRPKTLARSLKLSVPAANSLRLRLKRKFARFIAANRSAKNLLEP